MKKLIVVLLSLQCLGFSQSPYKTIKVSNDIQVIKLSDNAYVHVSYAELPQFGRFASNGLIFINGGEAFLFDTPVTDSLTKDLVRWIKDSLKVKLVGFMPNHWHADCMGGLGYLQGIGIESYANQMTIDIAKAKKLPIPAHGFKDSLLVRLGDKPMQSYYLGAAHSFDNIAVWIPSERILFAGCMVKSLDAKNLGNIADGDLAAYPKTIDKLMNKFPEAKIVIPGHGAIGGMELIAHTKDLLIKEPAPH
jgi:metallo-beta-lactamase class B